MSNAQGVSLGVEGKVALIVGGGAGMGEQSALKLSAAGCSVVVLDVNKVAADNVVAKITANSGKATAFTGDALDSANVGDLISRIEQKVGGINILVCIVGQAHWGQFLDVSLDDFDLDHHRNLRYVFALSQAVARSIVKRSCDGAFVMISSVSGVQSAPNHSSYGAAKAGLMNLVRSMAVELAEKNIRVNAVAPGAIATPRINASFPEGQASPALRSMLQTIPMGRMGQPEDIGNAVLFLSSGLARYITGHTLLVDGGLTAGLALGTIKPDAPPPSSAAR
jgi:NAD(P)-dependent dehydrogenase (short-subunit alcohol dehydrogenase family)